MPTATPSVARTDVTVGRPAVAVHGEKFGVGAVLINSGRRGRSDIELLIRFLADGEPVFEDTDVLAFCPAGKSCPWGASFVVTDDRQRSIDSAEVTVARVGPVFDEGMLRSIELRIDDRSATLDLPARRGALILYVVKDGEQPHFGMFRSHPLAEPETLRVTTDDLPIGPDTRAIFYEGHLPDAMLSGGH